MHVINLFCALAVIAAPTLFASTIPAAAQDKDNQVVIGELVFFSCQSCHFVGDAKERSGPHLNDLFGRRPGSLPDYEYSGAMVTYGQKEVWDEATLTTFLHDPRAVVAGTKMEHSGIKKDEELKALLAYLATFDADGMASK